MSNYLLAIYRKDLSSENINQIADLFSGATVNKINERMSLFLGTGYERKYNSQKDYYCFRIMSEKIVPAYFLLEPRPLYVGSFNETEEQKCALMTAHYLGVSSLIEANVEKGLNMEPYFKATFDQDSHLNLIAIENCIKTLKKKLRLAKSIEKKYFQDRLIKYHPDENEKVSLHS